MDMDQEDYLVERGAWAGRDVGEATVDGARGFGDGLKMFARIVNRIAALLVVAAMVWNVRAEGAFSFDSTPGKLAKDIVPRHYEIRLQPDLESFTTKGTETVEIEVLKPTDEIVLNVLDMRVKRATIFKPDEIALRPHQDAQEQTLRLKLPEKLEPGKYRLVFEFEGRMSEQAQGLFYARYSAPSGKKIMLATQMEPTDARRMFPCWDEPAFRATYDLTVVVPEKHLAVSNMPIERERALGNGLKEVKFGRTPPMASYLVVLVSGELEALEGQAEGVRIRVITTEGRKEQGRYALDATKKLLTYYNRYFGIKYPLPKLDQIAIPGGFSGAMENWGGLTYNESVLLFDPRTSSFQTKQQIFVTVAHEMSHQWFGDLVTTAWWDDLWLNEGFATWMETKATDHFNSDWQMWLNASSEKTTVMQYDARSTTHSIQVPVGSESEASDSFDEITYQKGGAILRMLEDYLGPEVFRRGIHRYLSAHAYSNTMTADLWEALEKESGKPVGAIASGWTEQPGLPLVTVKADCDNGRQVVSLRQKRFTAQYPDAEALEWEVPIALMDAAHPAAPTHFLLEGKRGSVTLPDCQGVIKANAGDTGYYRVAYEPTLFARLQKFLGGLPVADQLNLLNDGWAMVEANHAPATNYFSLVELLRRAKNYFIWDQIITTLYLIDGLEQGQPGRAGLQEYAHALLRPQLERLGWAAKDGESPNDALLRGRVIGALGQFGDKQVIAEARARFEGFLANRETLSGDMRPVVLEIAGRYSDRKVYEQIHALARDAQGTEERQMYYRALCAALDPDLARQTLALSLTDEMVPQEATDVVVKVASDGEHADLAWDFAREHIKELLAKVDTFDRNNYVPSIVTSFSDATRADELEAYVKTNVSDDALAKATETAEEIRFRAALKRRSLPEIDAWVASHPTGGANVH